MRPDTEISYRPGNKSQPAPSFESRQLASARAAIDNWQAKLLDVSKGNRLLRFRATKLATARISAPDLPELLSWMTRGNGGRPVHPAPQVETSEQEQVPATPVVTEEDESAEPQERARQSNAIVCDLPRERLWPVLYNLRQKAQAAIEERGVNVLFVALGFLAWDDPHEKDLRWRAPLILAPARLERTSADSYKLLALDEEIVLNPTLAHKLSRDYLLTLPELPDDPEGLYIDAFFQRVVDATSKLPRVEIERTAYVGLFQFLKVAMYYDLEHLADDLLDHPLTGRLAGLPKTIVSEGEPVPADGPLDPYIDPRDFFQVLDADSSQQEALLAARKGMSMVLQGPPGTGKSQTIANLIAEALADGKSILFVSEKEAALEVVKRRLDECGIGQLCLELHGHQANKKLILQQLRAGLEPIRVAERTDATAVAESVTQTRAKLNAYTSALHIPRFASNMTAFQVYGQLSHLRSAPNIDYRPDDIHAATPQLIHARQAALKAFAGHAQVAERYIEHPWRGLVTQPPTAAFLADLAQHLNSLDDALRWLEEIAREAQDIEGLRWPETLETFETLSA